MVLELYLSAEDDGIRRVVVKMNLDEARAFVNKLKAIEKLRLIACLSSPPEKLKLRNPDL